MQILILFFVVFYSKVHLFTCMYKKAAVFAKELFM